MKSLLLLLFAVSSLLYKAFLLTVLWGWFVVPHFDMAQLSTSVAFGLLLIYDLVSFKVEDKETDVDEQIGRLVYSVFVYTVILFTGWIVTLLT